MRIRSDRIIEEGEEACTSRKKRKEREGRSVRITSKRINEEGEKACTSRKKREER